MKSSMNKLLATALISGVIAGTTALADEATPTTQDAGSNMGGSKNGCNGAKKNSCSGKSAQAHRQKKKKAKNSCNSPKNGCAQQKKESPEQ